MKTNFSFILLFSLLAIPFTPHFGLAAEWPLVSEELRLAHFPSELVKTIELDVPAKLEKDKIQSVVYGHEKIGFFEIKNFELSSHKITFKMLPPTYLFPVSFFVRTENVSKPILLKSLSFGNPLLTSLKIPRKLKGFFSFPYFFNNVDVSGKGKKTAISNELPGIYNRMGELIWISNATLEKTDTLYDGFLSYSTGDGNFLFLSRRDESQLLATNGLGTEVKLTSFQKNNLPGNSHSFDYDQKTKTLYYLSFDCRELGFWDEFIPLFTGLDGFFRKLTAPKRSYMGAQLVALNTDTLKTNIIWNSFQNFSPNKNQSLALQGLSSPDLFYDVRSMEQYKTILENVPRSNWADWPDKRCSTDWTHENSVKFYPGKGFLISIRNLNKVIFIDEAGKLKYTVGHEQSDTYHFAKEPDSFSMQHSAELIDDKTLLLFDNNADYRGAIHRPKQNRILVINLEKPGLVPEPETYYIPFPKSQIKGSTTLLENQNIFVFKSGDPGVYSQILEINRKTKNIIAALRFRSYYYQNSIEAKPFYSLFGEKWLPGFNQEENEVAIPTEHENVDEVLQYSY